MKSFLHIKAKKIETIISYFDNHLWNVGIQKTSLNNLEKNRIIEYYGLVNLETSKPDFLRNSIADSSVKTCCFIGGLGFLNDS